ncbi:hypothetical protein AX17_001238 [Amanita inopinata Kibby_2008]|nr:hypothetical protein AX17_001238 [Amanita inopinata Kibby_2008]
MSFIDQHDSSPPPAYSEQDFDRKISTAVRLSLRAQHSPVRLNDEAWEEWNEDVFEDAARASSEKQDAQTYHPWASPCPSASVRHPTPIVNSTPTAALLPVEPLKINKRASVSDEQSKARPSSLFPPEAAAQRCSSETADRINMTPCQSSATHLSRCGQTTDPPEFECGSSSSSPLASPTIHELQQYATPYTTPAHLAREFDSSRQYSTTVPRRRTPRQSLPPIPHVQQHTVSQRPLSDYPSHTRIPTPILGFDPSIAYGQGSNGFGFKHSTREHEAEERVHDVFDVTSFYNAAVAGHLSPSPKSTQRTRLHSSSNPPQMHAFLSQLQEQPHNQGQSGRRSFSGNMPPAGQGNWGQQGTMTSTTMAGMAPAQNPATPRFSPSFADSSMSSNINANHQMGAHYYYPGNVG